MERAVQTTPPMTIEATMPEVPLKPMPTKIADAMMRVIRVIPDTGFEPTMAMALAATVVNRKAMKVTTIHAVLGKIRQEMKRQNQYQVTRVTK